MNVLTKRKRLQQFSRQRLQDFSPFSPPFTGEHLIFEGGLYIGRKEVGKLPLLSLRVPMIFFTVLTVSKLCFLKLVKFYILFFNGITRYLNGQSSLCGVYLVSQNLDGMENPYLVSIWKAKSKSLITENLHLKIKRSVFSHSGWVVDQYLTISSSPLMLLCKGMLRMGHLEAITHITWTHYHSVCQQITESFEICN